jgi:[acyl-carrier-protein] S-malonyltransferase
MDMACWAAVQEGLEGQGLDIAGMAGFSLGEYAALTAAGALPDFQTGLRLVRERAALMKAAGDPSKGGGEGRMVAVFGSRDAIEEAVRMASGEGVLEAVNFNSPIQTAVAGDPAALERLEALARAERTLRLKVKRLSVSAAFHSSMMASVGEKLRQILASETLSAPKITVYGNTTGSDIMAGRGAGHTENEWLQAVMSAQVSSPVYWQETLESMWNDGIRLFLEVGPGATLSGFVRKTLPEAVSLRAEDCATLDALLTQCRQMSAAE